MGKAESSKQPATPPPGKEGPRDFLVFLHKLGKGEAQKVLSEALFEMGQKLREECHLQMATVKGSIDLTVNFEADPEGDAVKTTYEVKSKPPKPKRSTTYLWLTPGGNLTTNMPKTAQEEFPFAPNARGVPSDLDDEEIPLED